MPKNPVLQTAVDFAQIGEETRRALKPKKKKNNNNHYKRQVRKISRGFGRR